MPGVRLRRRTAITELPLPLIRTAGRPVGEPDGERDRAGDGIRRELRLRRRSAGVGEEVDLPPPTPLILPDDLLPGDRGEELLAVCGADRHLGPGAEIVHVDIPDPAPLVLPGDDLSIDRRRDLLGGVVGDLVFPALIEIVHVDIGQPVPVIFPDNPVPRYRRVCLPRTARRYPQFLLGLDIVCLDAPGDLLPDDVTLREREFPLNSRRAAKVRLLAGRDVVEADIGIPLSRIVPGNMVTVHDGHRLVGRAVRDPPFAVVWREEVDLPVPVPPVLPGDEIARHGRIPLFGVAAGNLPATAAGSGSVVDRPIVPAVLPDDHIAVDIRVLLGSAGGAEQHRLPRRCLHRQNGRGQQSGGDDGADYH